MITVNDRIAIPDDELLWEFSRSGGPGGQNVNKVNSRAVLRWRPAESRGLPEPVKARLLLLVASRLTVEGELLIKSDRTRDQGKNVADCMEKLRELVARAANPPRPRRATKPTRASKQRRLESKRRRSGTKEMRKRPNAD